MTEQEKTIRKMHLSGRVRKFSMMFKNIGTAKIGDYISIGAEHIWLGEDEVRLVINTLINYNSELLRDMS